MSSVCLSHCGWCTYSCGCALVQLLWSLIFEHGRLEAADKAALVMGRRVSLEVTSSCLTPVHPRASLCLSRPLLRDAWRCAADARLSGVGPLEYLVHLRPQLTLPVVKHLEARSEVLAILAAGGYALQQGALLGLLSEGAPDLEGQGSGEYGTPQGSEGGFDVMGLLGEQEEGEEGEEGGEDGTGIGRGDERRRSVDGVSPGVPGASQSPGVEGWGPEGPGKRQRVVQERRAQCDQLMDYALSSSAPM